MHAFAVLVPLSALAWLPIAAADSKPSHKRGLVYTPNDNWPEDDDNWTKPGTGLSWYYNFATNASASYAAIAQDKLSFGVYTRPRLWEGLESAAAIGSQASAESARTA